MFQTAVIENGDTARPSPYLSVKSFPSVIVRDHNRFGICTVYRHTLSRGQLVKFAREFEIVRERFLVGEEPFRDFLIFLTHLVNSCH